VLVNSAPDSDHTVPRANTGIQEHAWTSESSKGSKNLNLNYVANHADHVKDDSPEEET
jgi:hypothetical protein